MAASAREATASLARMAPTCLEAVRGLMKSVSAISRSVRPAARSRKTSRLAGAQALGTGVRSATADAGRSGDGSRTPSARRRSVACPSAGFAPSCSKIAIARRTRSGSSLSARAHASSYGAAERVPGRGSPGEVAGDLQGVRLGQVVGRDVPARRLATAARRIHPAASDCRARRRGHAPPALLPALAPCRLSKRAASARAARTGPRRSSLPVRSASASASSSVAAASGLPRRAPHLAQRRQRHHPRHRR